MRLKILAFLTFGALFLLTTARTAQADTFDISWSGPYGAGFGMIDATDEGGGAFLVDSISATQGGLSLTLLPVGVYGVNNNTVYPGQTFQLDNFGLAFSDGSFAYNIYFNAFTLTPSYFECVSSSTDCQLIGDGVQLDNFQITAPEPGSMLLLVTGLLGLAAVRRKRTA